MRNRRLLVAAAAIVTVASMTAPATAAPGGGGGGGGGGGATAPTITINAVPVAGAPQPWLCNVSVTVTATGLKKATTVVADVNFARVTIGTLSKADNGVPRTFLVRSDQNDGTGYSITAGLMANTKVLATSASNAYTSSCDSMIQITGVRQESATSGTGYDCFVYVTYRINALPDPSLTYAAWMRRSGWSGGGTVGYHGASDIGQQFTIAATAGDNGESLTLYMTLSSDSIIQDVDATSNDFPVTVSC